MAVPDPTDEKEGIRDFCRSLPMALLQAREAVMTRFRPMLREHGVTEQQWRVLRALADGAVLEAGALARRCCLLTPSLTRIVRTLNRNGLILRRIDEQDLRRVLLAITPKGKQLIAEVAPFSEAHYAAITEKIGAANLAHLHKLLAELAATADSA